MSEVYPETPLSSPPAPTPGYAHAHLATCPPGCRIVHPFAGLECATTRARLETPPGPGAAALVPGIAATIPSAVTEEIGRLRAERDEARGDLATMRDNHAAVLRDVQESEQEQREEVKRLRAELVRSQDEAEQLELERNEARAQLAMARKDLADTERADERIVRAVTAERDALSGQAARLAGERDQYADVLQQIVAGTIPAEGIWQAAYDALDGATPGPDTIAALQRQRDRYRTGLRAARESTFPGTPAGDAIRAALGDGG